MSAAGIVVIGGGLAGAAAAVRLAAAGHGVTVVDPNPHLGGKMNVWEPPGFRFDMGPTVIIMPYVLDRLFRRMGRRLEEYLRLVRLEPQWRCFFADGSRMDFHGRVADTRAEIARLSPRDAAELPAFLEYARRMHAISEEYFFWRPYGGITDVLKDRGVLSPDGLRLGQRLEPFTSLHTAVRRHFRDPRVVQLFDHFVQYVGSSPFVAPAILTLIVWAQMDLGVWYPEGGTGAIARALERLADETGVRRRPGERVASIRLEGDRATGVVLESGETLPADAVVSNADVIRTHEELLPHPVAGRFLRRERRRLEPACSGVVLYLGCDRVWDHLAHHNFIFSEDPDREFADIYDRGVPTEDPTAYLAVPSVTDPGTAPPGHTALYVLVHTPHLGSGADWNRIGASYRRLLLERLERRGLEGLEASIRVERMLTPAELESLYLTKHGSIYGLLTRKGLAAAFKPGNRSRHFRGLYFAGGSVNPGAGVPMALMSGQIAAECVREDLGASPSGPAAGGTDTPAREKETS